MKVVILAGGYGTRIIEESQNIPKPLVEIGGRPVIWHIMKIYSHFGLNDFIVCCGYRGEALKHYFRGLAMANGDLVCDLADHSVRSLPHTQDPWNVTLVDTGDDTMTGGRLKRIAHLIDGPFCMTYSDGLADADIPGLIATHRRSGNLATVTAVNPPGRYGVLTIGDDNTVSSFREKDSTDIGLINGGFFALEPEALDLIDGDDCSWERGPMERLVAMGQLGAHRHRGFWHSMDSLYDKMVLEDLWRTGRAPWKLWYRDNPEPPALRQQGNAARAACGGTGRGCR